MIFKATRRYSNGLAFEWNYVFSKLLTDVDSFSEGGGTTQDHYNRRMEKSIGEFDQTHALKMSTVYELPFGKGRPYLSSSQRRRERISGRLEDWEAIMTYSSGFPVRLTRNNPLPIFNRDTRPTVTSYDDWRGPIQGDKFDPATDRFLNLAVFPTQPTDFGNVTRHNPKVRSFAGFNENVSLAKTFSITERFRLDFRWEAFNLFNRVQFGIAATSLNLNSTTFGVVNTQDNESRRMQVGLKLYF